MEDSSGKYIVFKSRSKGSSMSGCRCRDAMTSRGRDTATLCRKSVRMVVASARGSSATTRSAPTRGTEALAEVRELPLERHHRVAAVVDRDVVQRGDGAGDGVGAQEAEDPEHGRAPVVDLGRQAAGLGLLAHLLVETEGIVQVWDRVAGMFRGKYSTISSGWAKRRTRLNTIDFRPRVMAPCLRRAKTADERNRTKTFLTQDEVDVVPEQREGRVLPRLASLGVVREGAAAPALVPQLQRRDDREDLPLGPKGDGVPLGLRDEVWARVRRPGQGLRPREDEVALDAVPHECEHGYAAVLDL